MMTETGILGHIQWLEHASRRLEEAHHPNELYLLLECEHIDIARFETKIRVHVLGGPKNPSIPKFDSLSDDTEYFLRYA